MSITPFDGQDETTLARQQAPKSALGDPHASPADQNTGSPTAVVDGLKIKSGARTRAGKFKPGRSGNPRGRPPKLKEPFNEAFLRVLHDPVPVSVSGKQMPITMFEALVRSTLVHAFKNPRLGLAVIKTTLSAFELPKAAETQDNDKHDASALEHFLVRELERLRLIVANDADASSDDGVDPSDGDEVSAEQSA